ncbi:MFS transporter [Coraliomargarita sinensis]|uniref:MFS transporter n=1 Tax=Coraliomargarita sinensis TaxID=2174842 RepID=UPI0018EEB56B|nr:MFS transporter [Coraliomargarita sinensis]
MQRPKLSFWQIWNMSFGFFGIQFGFALQNANVSRIFETLGADKHAIPLLWIAAPLTGLIVQPIVGYFSDRTWCRLGRRRPYFLGGAVCASLALTVMPNSPYLWIAAGMLWIMDASINVSMEPFRAFVGDMLPSEQRTKGFAMQSFFIGAGSVIASALPYMLTNWFGVSNVAPEGVIPDSVKWSFYLGAAVFLAAVLWTVIKSKEYSPQELAAFEGADVAEDELAVRARMENESAAADARLKKKATHGPIFLIGGLLLTAAVYFSGWEKELYIVTGGFCALGALLLISVALQKKGSTKNGLVVVMNDLYAMPKTMKQLAAVQFFSWFALFSMWIYTTSGVTSHLYDMHLTVDEVGALEQSAAVIEAKGVNPDWEAAYNGVLRDLESYRSDFEAGADEVVGSMRTVNFFISYGEKGDLPAALGERLTVIRKEYNTGADWVGIAFAVYNGFAALVAFALPVFAKWTSRKITHAVALICGALGLASVYFLPGPNWILLSMLGVGIAWASILSMPYAILSGALPAEKMGLYMGIFNFFIVLPQMLAATILGLLVTGLFGGQTVLALMLGGATWVVAAILTLFVDDVDDPDRVEA